MSRQILRGTHLGASTDEEMRWAKAIKALMPAVEKVRFNSSGTEATLMAMRLARAYTGKNKVVKLQDHFHGWHDYAMAGSDRSAPGIPDASMGTMVIVPPGDLGAVEDALNRDDDIAALILEPTGAHMGQMTFDVPVYLKGLRELTAQHGVVLIFDEVVTGFRASPGGVQERYGIRPDLTTMAKIVAGGLPGGAVGGKADIIDMIAHRGDPEWDNVRRVYHPGTFNANPLSAAAGAAALELIASEPVNEHADAMADRLKAGFQRGAWAAGNPRARPRHCLDAPRGAGRLRPRHSLRVAPGNSGGRGFPGDDGNETGSPEPRNRHNGTRDHPGFRRPQ